MVRSTQQLSVVFANMNGIPPYHVPQRNKQHENPLSGLVIDLTCLNQTKTESGCREVIQNQLPG